MAVNEPDIVRDDYRRMAPPFSIGWNWLAETAPRFGFNDVALYFDAEAEAPVARESQALVQ